MFPGDVAVESPGPRGLRIERRGLHAGGFAVQADPARLPGIRLPSDRKNAFLRLNRGVGLARNHCSLSELTDPRNAVECTCRRRCFGLEHHARASIVTSAGRPGMRIGSDIARVAGGSGSATRGPTGDRQYAFPHLRHNQGLRRTRRPRWDQPCTRKRAGSRCHRPPNGSGKTTLFNIVSGLLAADRGSVLFNGANILGWKPHRIARQGIARTFQNARLFYNLTILQNCELPPICREPKHAVPCPVFQPARAGRARAGAGPSGKAIGRCGWRTTLSAPS